MYENLRFFAKRKKGGGYLKTLLSPRVLMDELGMVCMYIVTWHGVTWLHFEFAFWSARSSAEYTLGVFHLPRDSGNSGGDVNGTHFFSTFHWKISGINRTSEKVVLFSRWKLSDGKCVFTRFHQFQAFHAGESSVKRNGGFFFSPLEKFIRMPRVPWPCTRSSDVNESQLWDVWQW